MADTIKLRNMKRRLRSFNLEHPTFKNDGAKTAVGKPESITFLPLETKDVHPDVLECREVAAALRPKAGRPTLRVVG